MPRLTRSLVLPLCVALACLAGCGKGKAKPRPDADGGKDGGEVRKDGGGRKDGGEPVVVDERPWRTRETKLLTPAEAKAAEATSFVVSPDGLHKAYAVARAGGYAYVVDGVEDRATYKRTLSPRFSADGKDFAFVGLVSEEKGQIPAKFAAVVNGKAFAIPPVNHNDVAPKPHTIVVVAGGSVAYTGFAEKFGSGGYNWKLELFTDGKTVTKSAALSQYFTIERERIAGGASGGKVRLITAVESGIGVDGQVGFKTADRVRQVMLSENGATWAAVVETGAGAKKEVYVVVNGEEKKRFEDVQSLVLSPDGKHFGHLAQLGKKYVVIDGKATPAQWHSESRLTLAPDGGAWAVLVAGAAPVSSTGAAWPAHRYVELPAVSPDARTVAAGVEIIETKNDRFVTRHAVFIDGKEKYGAEGFDGSPLWSPDGRSLAVVTKAGVKARVVRDGKPEPAVEAILRQPGGKGPMLTYSRDGRSFAYGVREGLETKVFVNGKPRGAYDVVGHGGTRVGFTPDGRLTYLARKDDGSVWWVEELPPG